MATFILNTREEQQVYSLARHLLTFGARHLIVTDLTGISQHFARQMSEGLQISRGKPIAAQTALTPRWAPRAGLFAQHFLLALSEFDRLRSEFPRLNRAKAFISAYERQTNLPLSGEVFPVDLAFHTMKAVNIGEWSLKRCSVCRVPTLVSRAVPESHVRCVDDNVFGVERLYRTV